jgi:hypothetical protein
MLNLSQNTELENLLHGGMSEIGMAEQRYDRSFSFI